MIRIGPEGKAKQGKIWKRKSAKMEKAGNFFLND